MTRRFFLALAGPLAGAALATNAAAQPLGTFRWQLQPYCNVISVAVTQNGAIYRLEGTDDQCGAGADAASVTGTAFPNPDSTIGVGLTIVTTPGGRPLHVDAEIAVGSFGGTWRDSAGASGPFVLTPGGGNGGNPRPLPSAVPSTIVLRPDGGFLAGGTVGQGPIPASGHGPRTMWYPAKAAFRAGFAVQAGWDDHNVGPGSIALGDGPVASGESSVALGRLTRASGLASTALGGVTLASGQASTALGLATIASGAHALAGGEESVASGTTALAIGIRTRALGTGGVALGTRAVASGVGSFAFGDSASAGEVSAGTNEFKVRASGGVFFFSNPSLNVGVALAPNGNQWLTLSDVRSKHRFRELDGETVLAKIAALPVTEWSYKAQADAVRHIGPTAQDFHAAFGLGEDPLRIGTLDADGVALAAAKALEARSRHHMESTDQRFDRQAQELARLRAEVARLRALVLALTGSPR